MSVAELPAVVRVGGYTPASLPSHLIEGEQPVIFSGLVQSWPAVQGCGDTAASAWQYLQQFANDDPVTAYLGEPQIDGRFFYNEEFNGFNFRSGAAPLAAVLERLTNQLGQDDAQTIYVGSSMVDKWLPGFGGQRPAMPGDQPLVSFWLGNQSRIHTYDYPDNIACGGRTTTLHAVPTGTSGNCWADGTYSVWPTISLVDFAQPDFKYQNCRSLKARWLRNWNR